MNNNWQHTRILLSEAASKHLEATGNTCFIVASMDKSDERSGRWVLHLVPSTYASANAAVRVATGQSAERRPRKPKSESGSEME